MDQVLELKNIHYAYHNPDGETPAINGISFILNKGEFVAIASWTFGLRKVNASFYYCRTSHTGKGFIKTMGNTFTKALQM